MTKPNMILFDYRGTLMFDLSNGYKAIYPCISENPHNVSLEEFNEYFLCFFDEIREILLRSFLISFTHFAKRMTA